MRNLYAKLIAPKGSIDRPFLLCENDRQITFRSLAAETARIANALISLGVGVGDRVAAQVAKSPEALMLYLSTLRAGAIFLPLNTAYTPKELNYFLGDAEPALMVCDPEDRQEIDELAPANGC